MSRIFAIALAALLAAGCEKTPPDPIIVKEFVTPTPTPECLTASPQWIEPTDDMRLKPAARRDRTNKDNFNAMRSDRAICAAGLTANEKKG